MRAIKRTEKEITINANDKDKSEEKHHEKDEDKREDWKKEVQERD